MADQNMGELMDDSILIPLCIGPRCAQDDNILFGICLSTHPGWLIQDCIFQIIIVRIDIDIDWGIACESGIPLIAVHSFLAGVEHFLGEDFLNSVKMQIHMSIANCLPMVNIVEPANTLGVGNCFIA